MRTRPAVRGRLLLKLVPVFLGSIAICCGCDFGGGSGFGSGGRDDGESAADPAPAGPSEQDPALGPPDTAPPAEAAFPSDDETTTAPGRRGEPVDQPTGAVDPSDPTTWSPPEEVGPHGGERPQLEVDIVFSREYGKTVTDEEGTHYHVGDLVMHEDKVYSSEYWGSWPLYFFGTEVAVTVTVRNNGPRPNVKLRIRTEAYVLLTDGSSGAALAAPRDIDVEVARGESVTVDASFTAESTPEAESGLDRFVVKLLHPNAGGSRGNDEPALIMMKEGIFCPPEYQPDTGDEGF